MKRQAKPIYQVRLFVVDKWVFYMYRLVGILKAKTKKEGSVNYVWPSIKKQKTKTKER